MKEVKLSDILLLNGPIPFYIEEEKKLITYYCPWCGDNVGELSFLHRPTVIQTATEGENCIVSHLSKYTYADECNQYINKVIFDFEPKFGKDIFETEYKMLFKKK